jgi:hypothetical protein
VGGTIVGGGIWVHGFNDVRMIGSYPVSPDQWGIDVANMDDHKVDVSLCALTLS